MCGITTRVREVNGQIEAYPAMGLSLTYDPVSYTHLDVYKRQVGACRRNILILHEFWRCGIRWMGEGIA